MYWANFIHIYQPPTQTRSILERVVKESYQKILSGLLANPKARLTLNINGGLTEMLIENGHQKVVDKIRALLERGQIELTASAAYHPILPKLSQEEIQHQIELNEKINHQYFGPAYQPDGFFPPEMAYSPKVGQVVKDLGLKWVILDEVGLDQNLNPSKTYQNQAGLGFFFRERSLSFKILSAQLGTAKSLIRELSPRLSKNEYLLTAMDGETFGHHRLGLEELLWEICKEPRLPTVTISSLFELFPEKVIVEPKDSSWALTGRNLAKEQPFIRWDDPENEIQEKQWQLLNLAIKAVKKDRQLRVRKMLDKALYSDQFWWASARPWWSLEMIEQGAHQLLKVVSACNEKVTQKTKEKAKDLYLKIITSGFEWQRSGRIEEMSHKEDEEVRERMQANNRSLTREDYNQMIKSLRAQMLAAAKDKEYARAEQFKRRILELIADRDQIPRETKEEIKVNQ
ncbi:MAG TPA: polysaccharide deacetylase family protein [Clostridia bacterium]|nr:polysaccharide deacetylase family protein [Clostridia bacterium]